MSDSSSSSPTIPQLMHFPLAKALALQGYYIRPNYWDGGAGTAGTTPTAIGAQVGSVTYCNLNYSSGAVSLVGKAALFVDSYGNITGSISATYRDGANVIVWNGISINGTMANGGVVTFSGSDFCGTGSTVLGVLLSISNASMTWTASGGWGPFNIDVELSGSVTASLATVAMQGVYNGAISGFSVLPAIPAPHELAWIFYSGGLWFYRNATTTRPLQASDLSAADLAAWYWAIQPPDCVNSTTAATGCACTSIAALNSIPPYPARTSDAPATVSIQNPNALLGVSGCTLPSMSCDCQGALESNAPTDATAFPQAALSLSLTPTDGSCIPRGGDGRPVTSATRSFTAEVTLADPLANDQTWAVVVMNGASVLALLSIVAPGSAGAVVALDAPPGGSVTLAARAYLLGSGRMASVYATATFPDTCPLPSALSFVPPPPRKIVKL